MLKIYNTLTQKKEILKPIRNKKVNLFVCGPTVYDFSHIGHARTYVVFDTIVKFLRQKGFDVFYLQNITDIDDKIINRAKEINTTPKKLAFEFEKEYSTSKSRRNKFEVNRSFLCVCMMEVEGSESDNPLKKKASDRGTGML